MSTRPRIALRVHGGLPARECAAQARAAEEAGFSTVWFAENAFGRGAMSGLAASALATRTIRLGVGVFSPFTRHPTLIAMEMAALDELSDGRAVLGIGSGIRLAQIGMAAPRRIAAVRDAIHIVSRLLRGETVEYDGPVFSARGVRLECPLRRAAVPILMAAMGDQALDLCGRIADGLIISNLSPPAFTRRAVGVVARGAAAAGRPMPAEVVQYVTGAIDEDRHEARRRAKAVVGAMLVAYCHDGRASAATQSAVRAHHGREDDHGQRRVRPRAAGHPGDDGDCVWGMDRCRPGGNGRPAPPGPRPPGRAVGPYGSRGVLRVHPGTTRGAVEGRWGPGRPLAQERVLCVVTRRGPGRPAPVLRPGAPSEVAHLHEGVPRRGRALWGEADRLVGSASRGRSSYAARTCHGPLHRPRLTVAARSLGHLSSSDLRRPDRYFLGRPGGCGATGHTACRLHGASAALSARFREPGGDPEPGELYSPPPPLEPGHVPLRRGHPRLSHPM